MFFFGGRFVGFVGFFDLSAAGLDRVRVAVFQQALRGSENRYLSIDSVQQWAARKDIERVG